MYDLEFILNKIDENSVDKKVLGSEDLFLVMYELEDSILKEVLDIYDIDEDFVYAMYNDLLIFRKFYAKYTKELLYIIDDAKKIAKSKGEEVLEIHLIYSIIQSPDTIACHFLKRMYLDLEDLLDVLYEIKFDENNDLVNLTKLAKKNELAKYIDFNNYLERIKVTLNKKIKNNPLLIGDAGVGKTAIVEGLAMLFSLEDDKEEIYALELAKLVANTKYRGDFEAKVLDIVEFIKNDRNRILFIDEIHNLLGCGKTDGSLDAANILKPMLARDGFKCIGATTIEEYLTYIKKDKALMRRFEVIYIIEPTETQTLQILTGIKDDFETFYNISINDEILEYIVSQATFLNHDLRFPDKAIDLLDESLSLAKRNGYLAKNHVDLAIDYIQGTKKGLVFNDLFYKYVLNYEFQIKRKTLLNILYQGDKPNNLIVDLEHSFGINHSHVLVIDLNDYANQDLSSLIGSSKGYVGYDDGGLVTKHLAKYNKGIICFRNYDLACFTIKNFVDKLLSGISFYDNLGNYINPENYIFICGIKNSYETSSVGFVNKLKKVEKTIFDEIITDYNEELENPYLKRLKDLGFEIITTLTDEIIEKYSVEILSYFKTSCKGKYEIRLDELENVVVINLKSY